MNVSSLPLEEKSKLVHSQAKLFLREFTVCQKTELQEMERGEGEE